MINVTVKLPRESILLSNLKVFVSEGNSVKVTATSNLLTLKSNSVNLYLEKSPLILAVTSKLNIKNINPSIKIFSFRKPKIEKRFHRSSWQSRIGAKLDPLRRKVLDNQILLTAHATDMLRIKVDKDKRSHDIISRTVISSEILPIVFPVMEDVPMRRLTNKNGEYLLSMAMTDYQEKSPLEVYCPLVGKLERGDLLFRQIKDIYSDNPYFMALQVKEELGTISYSSLLYVKYILSFYDEKLPQTILEELSKASKKREELQW